MNSRQILRKVTALESRQTDLESRVGVLEKNDIEPSHWNETNVKVICMTIMTWTVILLVAAGSYIASITPIPTPNPVPDKTVPVVPPDTVIPEPEHKPMPEPEPSPEPEETFREKIMEIVIPLSTDIRDRWSWCYRDAVKNYSTDVKLREDVRNNSIKAMTEPQRKDARPVDEKIKVVVEEEVKVRPLKDVYADIGEAMKVNDWTYDPSKTTPNQTGSKQTVPKATRYRIIPQRGACINGYCPL